MEHNMSTTLLQLRYPDVHRQLIQEFEKIGLHSYDVKADVLESKVDETDNQNSLTLRVRFGETFTEYEELILPTEQIGPDNESILEFFKNCAQIAHETLKDEYKASMNIGRPRKKTQQNER